MVIQDKLIRYCVIFAVAAVLAVLGVYAFRAAKVKYEKAMVAAKELAIIAEKIDHLIRYDELTHWEREEWEIETFFHSPDAIKACELISSKDNAELKKWILAGGDVNLTGDHGMTLLFWAMLDRNMSAFQILLRNDADAESVLSSHVALKYGRYMYKNDSVAFAAIEFLEYDFVLAALPHLSEPNVTCIDDHNLISRITESTAFYNTPSYVYAELVRSGVNPDVRGKRHGSVPAVSLLCLNKISACYQIVVAGADPRFESEAGESVVSVVRFEIEKHNPMTTTPDYQKLTQWLIDQGYLEPGIIKLGLGSASAVTSP